MSPVLAGIEYVGIAGVSAPCKGAVVRLLQCGVRVTKMRILSASKNHCLLLTADSGDLVAVKSGFASGYVGEGPRTFSFVVQLIDEHGADIEEYDVDAKLLDRLDMSALTTADIRRIDRARPIRPARWPDYVSRDDWEKREGGKIWCEFDPVMPFSIVDPRIIDLALQFSQRPDDSLLKGYRRLEDTLRNRTGIDKHSTKLFSEVFQGETPKLTWENVDDGERSGRSSLFTGAFMAYRNPRAHRERKDKSSELIEFLLLNHLFILEREATEQKTKARARKDSTKIKLSKTLPNNAKGKRTLSE